MLSTIPSLPSQKAWLAIANYNSRFLELPPILGKARVRCERDKIKLFKHFLNIDYKFKYIQIYYRKREKYICFPFYLQFSFKKVSKECIYSTRDTTIFFFKDKQRRQATKSPSLVARPLRGGGRGLRAGPLRKKNFFEARKKNMW